MLTRTKDLDKTLLQIEILRQIPRRPYHITTTEIYQILLDQGYAVSKRTIERHLKTLSEHFEDLICDDRSQPYAYAWNEFSQGFSLPRLNEPQSLLLKLAEQQLSRILPANLFSTMQPFFEQASRVLAEKNSGQPARWLNKVCTPPSEQPLIPAKIDDTVFSEVSKALFYDKQLRMTYRNQKGEEKIHQISPLAIFPQFASVYMVAKVENYTDFYAVFALHRVQSAEMLTLSADRPADFDLTPYRSYGAFPPDNVDRYQLRFSVVKWRGYFLLETPLSEDQILLSEDEDFYRFQATVEYTELLDWWLKKFGDDIKEIEWIPA